MQGVRPSLIGDSRCQAPSKNADVEHAEPSTQETYDPVTIRLHWATVGLVSILWIIGRTTPLMPRGALRVDVWSVHVLLGVVLTGVVVTRVAWRLSRGRILPAPDRGTLRVAATIVHFALYLLLFTVIVLGITNAFAHAFAMFNVWNLPKIGDDSFSRTINGLHGLAANSLVALAALHSGAALFHHFVRRDSVLGRMAPRSWRWSTDIWRRRAKRATRESRRPTR